MLAMRVELLQGMPIFGAIDERALAFLLEQTRTVTVRAGEYFFRETDPADCMYVLEAGRVAVLKSWQGRELLMRYLGEGDCFGEMALMDLLPRSASVRAEEDCKAIVLTPEQFNRLFEHDPVQFTLIQMNIGREVCRRLRVTDELLFRAKMGEVQDASPEVFRST
jgi:CRP/FNR family cyclic AMP-dependent transcriptional regulator